MVRDLRLPTDPGTPPAPYARPMPSTSQRALTWFGVDDEWERPRPRVGRQDVVLAAGVEAVSLLALELVRSAGGLEHTDAPVWAQWLAVSTGAALLLGRRRWPLVVASLAALHMFVAGVSMPEVMGQVSLQIVYFVALLRGSRGPATGARWSVVIGTIVLLHVRVDHLAVRRRIGGAGHDRRDGPGRIGSGSSRRSRPQWR